MMLSPELHVALVRLHSDLNGITNSIRKMVQGFDLDALDMVSAAQCRALEAALVSLPDVQPATVARKGAALSALHIGVRDWSLCQNGWALARTGAAVSASIYLRPDERAILMRLVQSPDRRISHADLRDMLDPAARVQKEQARHVRVISRLRVRALSQGLSLPIHAVHGWGYRLGTEAMPSIDQDDVAAASPRPHADDPPLSLAPISLVAAKASHSIANDGKKPWSIHILRSAGAQAAGTS